MKHFYLLMLLSSLSQLACAFSVTFRVDMSNVTGFTTPEVNGTFNAWCGNCIPLSDIDGDNIWDTTIDLSAGSYEYKFAADNWELQESLVAGSACTVTNFGFTNRHLEVTGNIVLPIVCWSFCTSCNETPGLFNVTFQIDMSNQTGFDTPEVNGMFNNWCGNCNAMSDADGDNVWTETIQIHEGTYLYKFSYDNWAGQEVLTPGTPCTETEDNFTNRWVYISSDIILPVQCWESCVNCSDMPNTLYGCTNVAACNYNPNAIEDNSTCIMPGCMDTNASNYAPNAICQSPESCVYVNPDCPADLDFNGTVGVSDLLILLAAIGNYGNSLEDLDANGVVGAYDIASFIEYYGSICPN
jgi:hypothetical protein